MNIKHYNNDIFYEHNINFATIFNVCVFTFIEAGCSPIAKVDNGQISYINKNTIAILLCDPYYEAVGSAKSFCNGLVWDRAIGSCKEASNAPLLECNFESESICGYIHDSENDFDFIRSSGYNNRTMTLETGPHADHTIGE